MGKVSLISPITKQNIQKTRVAAYCRVSSSSADQLNSYVRQVKVYTELIEKRKDWQMVKVFADEGISGMKAENRPEFQRMIRMCELHQIDLIITKSVSRFARNVKEALEYVRKLKLLGIGVQFEKEGIFTLALGDEMLLNTFTAIAQEESKAISQNQRLSIIKRMADGEYVDSNAPYGFRLVDKNLVVYEPEAEVVRSIFKMYLDGYSTTEIARELDARNIPTKGGAEKWKSTKVAYILANERYIGDCYYQKTYRDTTVPFKQYSNRGQEDRFYAKATHEKIIDNGVFNKVQQILSKKKERFSKITSQNIYPLTSKVNCEVCGSVYKRRQINGNIKWACTKHLQDCNLCKSYYYSEERIYDGFVSMVNKLRFGEENILGIIIQKLQTATVTYKRNNITASQISQDIAKLNAKLVMIEQLRSKGYLTPDVYQSQVGELNQELIKLKNERQVTFQSNITEMLDNVKQLKMLIDEIEEPMEDFDEKLFSEIVTNITISNSDEMTITVIGGLKFAEVI